MKSELFINTRNGKIIGFGAKDGDVIESGKYHLLDISVTPLSSALPPLELLDKLPLDLIGDGGAGEHLAGVVAPPDRLWLLE